MMAGSPSKGSPPPISGWVGGCPHCRFAKYFQEVLVTPAGESARHVACGECQACCLCSHLRPEEHGSGARWRVRFLTVLLNFPIILPTLCGALPTSAGRDCQHPNTPQGPWKGGRPTAPGPLCGSFWVENKVAIWQCSWTSDRMQQRAFQNTSVRHPGAESSGKRFLLKSDHRGALHWTVTSLNVKWANSQDLQILTSEKVRPWPNMALLPAAFSEPPPCGPRGRSLSSCFRLFPPCRHFSYLIFTTSRSNCPASTGRQNLGPTKLS